MEQFVSAMRIGAEFMIIYFTTLGVGMAVTAIVMLATGQEID